MGKSVVPLGLYTKIKTGKLDANASSVDGEYPFFTCSKEPLRINSHSYDCECVLVAGNGDLNVKYYSGKFDAYQRTYIIESTDKRTLNTRYLFYFLDKYVDKLREQSIGGVIKYIKLGYLVGAQLPLPPLPAQQQIANVLDRASILIKKRKAQIEKLDLLIKSQFIEMFGDLNTNSMGWEEHFFTYVATIDTHMTNDFNKYADYPHIGIENIEKNTGRILDCKLVRNSDLKSGKYPFDERHLIYSKIRPNLNKVAKPDFSGVCSADAYPILPTGYSNREYLAIVLRSDFFLDYILAFSGRTNIPKVNKKQLESFSLPVPPLPLQTQFAAFVHRIEAQKSLLQKSLADLEQNYKSLMQKCFRGEVF